MDISNFKIPKKNPKLHSAEHILADEIYKWTDKEKGEFGKILGRIKQLGLTSAYSKWKETDGAPSRIKSFMMKT